jgi:hypothetical protein
LRALALEQIDHLRLDRRVKRRDRLVGDQRHFCANRAAPGRQVFICQKPPANEYSPDNKTGGCIMTSRLAFSATMTAAVLLATGASAQTYEVTKLVPGSAFHGVHGLGIDKSGRLFAGSVAGAALYEVDRANGTAKIAIPTPEGMADDIAFAPDGTMAWTGFLTGDLYSRKGDGPIKKLASGLPGINSLAFRKDGRLYAPPCSSATRFTKSTSRAQSRRARSWRRWAG